MNKFALTFIGLLVAFPALAQETPAAPAAPATVPEKVAPVATGGTNRISDALAKLPPEKAQMFDEVMRRNIDANRATQNKLRTVYIDLRKNFTADTFNKADFLARSAEARELQNALRESLDKDLAEVIDKFSKEEREIIFSALPSRYTRDMEDK